MDIRCSVCGEPHEADHLDMLPWEAKLFNQGAGCPCCEGVKPANVVEDDAWIDGLQDRLLNGLDDYGQQDLLIADPEGAHRPKWERPADEEVWRCDGCGVQVMRNADDGEIYTKGDYHICRELDHAEEYDPVLERDGYKYCHACVVSCDNCGEQYVEDDDCTYTIPDGYCQVKHACCEECFSALEYEGFEESWDSWGRRELVDELSRHHGLTDNAKDLLDDVDSDVLREWWMHNANEPYFMESGGVNIPIRAYANRMARSELAKMLYEARHKRQGATS